MRDRGWRTIARLLYSDKGKHGWMTVFLNIHVCTEMGVLPVLGWAYEGYALRL